MLEAILTSPSHDGLIIDPEENCHSPFHVRVYNGDGRVGIGQAEHDLRIIKRLSNTSAPNTSDRQP